MSSAARLLDSVIAIVRRDAAIYFSYRFRALSQVLIALFSLTLFFYISRLVGGRRFPDPEDYFAFVVVGLVILQALTATLALVPHVLRTELVAGTFERLAVSPLGPAAAVAALTVFPVVSAFAIGAVTIMLATTLFGLSLAGTSALLAIPVAALALLAFLPFALMVAALVLISKQAGSVGNLVVVGLSLVGGVYFPPELMPSWIRWVTDVQPFTPALELLRHLLIGTATTDAAALQVLRLAAFALLVTPPAYWLLAAAIRVCRRRGTLIEY